MINVALQRSFGWVVLSATLLGTIGITPYLTADPVNLPKMLVLSVFGFIGVAMILVNRGKTMSTNYRVPLIALGVFLLNSCAVLFLSGGNITQQLFGTSGRNTGFITYASLAFLMASGIYASSRDFLKRFLFVLLVAGLLSMMYGQVQYMDKDPLPWARVYPSPVTGFLGNPNFQSAFMGMFAVVTFVLIFAQKQSVILRLVYGLLALLAILGVKESGSQQGYLNFIAGVFVAVLLYLYMKKSKIIAWAVSAIGIIGTVLVAAALLNIGPLAAALNKSSLEARRFYWRAAVNMTLNHPFFGVGMDHYGDWYFRSRSQEAVNSSAGLYADTAHNVPLDISSYGGFPLLVTYLALIILVIIAIVKVVKRTGGFDARFTAIVGAWVAYQAQSIISINVPGLAVWGWVLGGLIIGYEINTRDIAASESNALGSATSNKRKMNMKVEKVTAGTTLAVFVGAIIGLAAGLPPFVASVKFNSAIKADDAIKIRDSALIWPHDISRMVYVAKGLIDIKLEKESREIILQALEEFPDSFYAWSVLATLPNATPSEIALAKTKMKELDPLHPEFK